MSDEIEVGDVVAFTHGDRWIVGTVVVKDTAYSIREPVNPLEPPILRERPKTWRVLFTGHSVTKLIRKDE